MDFQKDLIQLDQSFQTKEEAIRFCGNLLADGGYVENDYVEAMIQRNKELSVYMGNFIAIPHGTDEAKEKVLKSGITVVQVPDGVNFGIAGIGNEHLEIIQKISIFCADVDNVVKLADTQSKDEIIRLLNNVE